MEKPRPGEKSSDFKGSGRRFLREIRPERSPLVLVVVLAVASVFLAVIGPKLLGHATNIIFDGFVGKHLPAGVPVDQIVAQLEASGQTTQAKMLAGMPGVVPGQGL